MTPQISLHIGAHKTATTHLQRSLSAQGTAVRASGAAFFGPPHFRNGPSIAARFGLDGDVSATAAKDNLLAMADGARRVVLSEENFIGTLQNRFGKVAMPLYPKATVRLARLAGRIAPSGLDVFLGLRNPADFLTSAYCQALMAGSKAVLDEVKEKNPLEDVNWAELVQRIALIDGVRSLTVWRYEDYRPLFAQIVHRMLDAPAQITPIDDVVHPGLSHTAVTRILAHYAAGKTRKTALRVRDRFPVGADHPAFDAYSPAEHATARAQYADQIAQIAAMPDVTFLKA